MRRLLAIAAALAIALGIPLAPVAADTGPPTGSYLQITWTDCTGNPCLYAALQINRPKVGSDQVCLSLSNFEYSASGCTSTFGAITSSKGLATGIAETVVRISDGTNPSRDVRVSAATSIQGPIQHFADTFDVDEGNGCVTTFNVKSDVATLDGMLTVDGAAHRATGDTYNTVKKSKTRCV